MENASQNRILARLDRIESELETLNRRLGAIEQRSGAAVPLAPPPLPPLAAAPRTPPGEAARKFAQSLASPAPAARAEVAAPVLRLVTWPHHLTPRAGAWWTRPAAADPAAAAGRPLTLGEFLAPVAAHRPAAPAPHLEVTAADPGAAWSEEWRVFLRQFNLLPPQGEGGNIEIQVGTWWASRIGTLFMVIAIVFGGIYMAKFSSPWVRFTELTAASLGLALLGLGLERRYPKYGPVLFGGGLAALFFCSFAAYALPAVKVLQSAAAGAIWQFLAASAIIGCAQWRRSPVIATMGVLCGYVSCFFSCHAGLNNFALTAALLLSGVASYFYLAPAGKQNEKDPAWSIGYGLSIPLTYLLYFCIFLQNWVQQGKEPEIWVSHGCLLVYLGLYAGVDIAALRRGRTMRRENRILLQLLNSGAAVFLGFCLTTAFYPGYFSEYYFTYGSILTALAAFYYMTRHPDALMEGYFLKGSALVTMGLIAALGGRTRWVALGVESFVLLVSARRTRLKITELMMGVVWLASLGFFMDHLARNDLMLQRGARLSRFPVLPGNGLPGLLYLVLAAWLAVLKNRWLGHDAQTAAAPAFGPAPASGPAPGSFWGRFFNGVAVMGLNLAIIVFSLAYAPYHQEPASLCLTLAVLLGAGLLVRHWIFFAAGTVPLLLAHLMFWMGSREPAANWIDGGAAIALTLACALLLDRWLAADGRRQKTSDPAAWEVWIGVLHLLWMFTLQMLYGKVFTGAAMLFAAAASTVVIAALTLRVKVALLRDLAPIPLVLVIARLLGAAFVSFADAQPSRGGALLPYTVGGSELFLWAALALAWGYACAFAAWEPLGRGLRLMKEQNAYQWFHGIVALLVGVFVLSQSPGLHGAWAHPADPALSSGARAVVLFLIPMDQASLVLFGLAALAVMSLARRPGFKPGLFLGMVYLVIAHRVCYGLAWKLGGTTDLVFLGLAIGLALLTLGTSLLARRLWPGLPRQENRQIQWVWGASTLGLCLWLFGTQRGELSHYTTALWGISAIGIFLAGLLGRAKPLRIVGLAGMAVCIPRVFIVDIRSDLYRIAATAVLGTVVLLVAFLYNKYKGAIEAWDEKDSL